MKKSILTCAIIVTSLCFTGKLYAQISAAVAVKEMCKGINIGNTFDAPPGETSWGQPAVQEYFFDDFVAQGITAVRIPITWDEHLGTSAPYAIDPAFLNRIEQVVDWGLSKGLYILINTHHDWWIRVNYGDQSKKDRFAALWTQISSRFLNKSYKLLFEIVNEPDGMSVGDLNDLQSWTTNLIRNSGGNNNKRIIVFCGNATSDALQLAQIAVPSDDHTYMMGNFHCYTPWDWMSGTSPTWSQNWAEPQDKFNIAVNWARANNCEVMVNEYGCVNSKDYESRMEWFRCYTKFINDYNFAAFIWDVGGDFKAYDKINRTWLDYADIVTTPVFSRNGCKAVAWYSKSGSVRRYAESNGEYYAGEIQKDDWINYRITVPKAGTHIFEAVVASPDSTGVMRLEENGGATVFETVKVPKTGGWGTWKSISKTITLPAGDLNFTITATTGGFNLKTIKLTPFKTPAKGVSISPKPSTLAINETDSLHAVVTPDSASIQTVTWSSSDTTVARIDIKGVVTGKAAGTAVIKAKTDDGGFTDSCLITVSYKTATGMSLPLDRITVEKQKTVQLTPVFVPANASNKTVTYSSSDTAKVKVSASGLITGVSEGAAVIKARTVDNNFTDSVQVTVFVTKYLIKSRWKNTYLYDAGDRVRYNATATDSTYQWTLEDFSGAKMIKNSSTGHYMLIENQLGYIQCAIGNTGRLSQQWLVEDAGSDYVRFRSKWLANQYINVEGQQGYAQYGTINSDWSSAMWTLEPQAVEVSVLVCARPCGIVTQARLTVRGNVLMVTQASPGANVTVYDVLGKTVLCQAVPKTGRLELKVARGIYFCKLTDSKLKASDALRIVVR